MKIKVGSLVQIQHFGSQYNGKIGIVIYVCKDVTGHYAVKIPNTAYEIGVAIELLKVLA
jgi:hypothetical protein